MNIIKRYYQPGDERDINRLYKIISGINRSVGEYQWEWIDTWDSKGSIWLAFDNGREKGDRLIMQFGLIPTPFSFWGENYQAGKTENCMSHPDCRGAGIYFPHEEEGFKVAQKRFQLFFTTDGNAGKGAAGAIRRKLGYIAFDSWSYYSFFLTSKYLKNLLLSRFKNFKKIPDLLTKFLAIFVSYFFAFYFRLCLPLKPSADIRVLNKNDVSLEEIENFWKRNKSLYMITVDRQSSYLEWRINKNPYFDYKYVVYYKDNQIIGYAIISLNKNNACMIEDILVEKRDSTVFDTIISYVIWHAKENMGADVVSCNTLTGNKMLKAVFIKNKFIDIEKLRRIIERKKTIKAFHLYVTPDVQNKKDIFDPQNWYITDLVSEGRPFN